MLKQSRHKGPVQRGCEKGRSWGRGVGIPPTLVGSFGAAMERGPRHLGRPSGPGNPPPFSGDFAHRTLRKRPRWLGGNGRQLVATAANCGLLLPTGSYRGHLRSQNKGYRGPDRRYKENALKAGSWPTRRSAPLGALISGPVWKTQTCKILNDGKWAPCGNPTLTQNENPGHAPTPPGSHAPSHAPTLPRSHRIVNISVDISKKTQTRTKNQTYLNAIDNLYLFIRPVQKVIENRSQPPSPIIQQNHHKKHK